MDSYDLVVCGAGTAGCILANRLSSDPQISVLLLEAGQAPRHPLVHAIGATAELWNGPLDWAFPTVQQRNLNNRQILLNRGKGLGGSSTINMCMYVRGNRGDYDLWAESGNRGWSYDDVLPYFRRSESNASLSNEFHGADGPIIVEDPRNRNALQELYFQALAEYGIARNPDYNGAFQEGGVLYQYTSRNGRRCSAADGFLTPILDRPNLTIVTGAHVTGLSVSGSRVTGVHYALGRDAVHVRAVETILSLGAIGSPHMLLLSGIGPAAEIETHGIECVHDLPGVGKNLLDHFSSPGVAITLRDPEPYGFPICSVEDSLLQFEADSSGPLATMEVDAGAFVRLRATDSQPSGQLLFTVKNGHRSRSIRPPQVRFGGYVCRTLSQGEITLASKSPFDRPLVDPNYLDDPEDLDRYVELIQFCYSIADHPAFESVRDRIVGPGRDREAIIAHTRAEASTTWHQVSTCRMGIDEMAVVAPDLKVHGMEGIRVIDASIFPTMPSGNTNAPTMMVAEKGADLVLGAGRSHGQIERPAPLGS